MFSIGAQSAYESGKKALKAPTAHTAADSRLGAPTKRKKTLTVRRLTAWAPTGGAHGAYQAPVGVHQRSSALCQRSTKNALSALGVIRRFIGASRRLPSGALQAVCRRSKTPTGARRRLCRRLQAPIGVLRLIPFALNSYQNVLVCLIQDFSGKV